LPHAADTLAQGVATTATLLGTGTPNQPGTLSAAAGAVRAAPEAAHELSQQVVLPAVKDFAEGVVTVAKDAQVQVRSEAAQRGGQQWHAACGR
jgi:hypothetical protein